MSKFSRDHTVAFLARPYHYIERTSRQCGSDVFDTTLLFEPTICMTGAEAARAFYTEPKLVREGAAPEAVRATLFGKGGVQQLDGEHHHHRRAVLLSILAPDNINRLVRRIKKYWAGFDGWAPAGYRLPLYETSQHVLTLSVCEWLGVDVPDANLSRLSHDLSALFNEAAGAGHLKARRARRRLERWLVRLVDAERRLPNTGGVASLFHELATFTDVESDARPPARIIAVEALNIMRPIVAVSVYIVWMAHALMRHPEIAIKLERADPVYRRAFVDEVRRFYPFFPAVAARVHQPFRWRGHDFERGARVLLDIHGTNRDPRYWHRPDAFLPDRFLMEPVNPYAFIPQGAGDNTHGHRCPGESATVAIMLASLDFVRAHLPPWRQDRSLAISDSRLPALPTAPIYIETEPARGRARR